MDLAGVMGISPAFMIMLWDEYFFLQWPSSRNCTETRALQIIARTNTKNHDPTYWPVVFGAHVCEKIMVARFAVLVMAIGPADISEVGMGAIPDMVFDIPDMPDIAVVVEAIPVAMDIHTYGTVKEKRSDGSWPFYSMPGTDVRSRLCMYGNISFTNWL